MRKHTPRAPLCACWLAAVCSLASAHELPARQPGLWEISLNAPGSFAPRVRQCAGPAHDVDALLAIAPAQSHCASKPQVSRTGDAFVITTQCTVHGMPVSTHFELTGDLHTHYRGRYVQHRATAARPYRQQFEARWLGPCPPSMKPGDSSLSNGIAVPARNADADAAHAH